MTQDKLVQMSPKVLIDLSLALHSQLEALQAAVTQRKEENEELRVKVENGKELPRNLNNPSQPRLWTRRPIWRTSVANAGMHHPGLYRSCLIDRFSRALGNHPVKTIQSVVSKPPIPLFVGK
jgi:hypothetical protein